MKVRPLRFVGDLAYVPLTKGFEAVIDASDAHLVDSFNWCASENGYCVYAKHVHTSDGGRKTMLLHRVITGADDDVIVDHIDGNGLNNRRSNLRTATHSQNMFNQRTGRANTSGFKGVSWHKDMAKWEAHIQANGKKVNLGYFSSPEDASNARKAAAVRLHADFARDA